MTTDTTTPTNTHVIPKGQPVAAIVGGVVVWRVAKGATVAKYDSIASVDDVEITAAYSGRVSALMVAEGGTVAKGATIAYIDDGKPPTSQKPLQAAPPVVGVNRPASPQTPQAAPQVQTAEPIAQPSPEPRTRRNAYVEPLEVVPIVEPEKPTKSKKRRMVVRSFTISKADDTELGNKIRRLRKYENAPNEITDSLLIRVGIAFLNTLKDESLIEKLNDQIQKEKEANIGAGRRRIR